MTGDELERMMNFIIERQEYTAAHLAKFTEQQADHNERIARFERSYTVIADLLQKHDTQIESLTGGVNNLVMTVEGHDFKIGALTDWLNDLVTTAKKHDTQIEAMTEGLNKLVTTVNRYITARGNGSNGA